MHLSLAVLVASSSLVAIACSSAPNTNGGGDAAADSPQQQGSDGSSQNDTGLSGPAAVNVTIAASCPGISPCGGDPTGTWDYASGCAQVDLGPVTQACSGATVSNLKATVAGRVTFAAAEVTRLYKVQYQATLGVPAACSQPAGGCPAIQAALAPSFDTTTCSDDGNSGCTCDVAGHLEDAGGTSYTVQGDQIVTGDGNRYDFCAQGGTMSYRHANGSSPEAGSFQLTKR